MKSGQRVKLIRKIAKNMSKYGNWNEVDLILRQFEFRTQDHWADDLMSYTMAMIEHGNSEKLRELDTFLLEEFEESHNEEGLTKSVDSCWSQGKLRVFISHSSKNKTEVVDLKNCLSNYGIASFVAHEDINPTEDWQREILCGLDTCHALIAWSTPEFETSVWAQQEVGYVLAKRKVIISIRKGVDPLGFTSKEQGVRGNCDMLELAKNIVSVLIEKPLVRDLIHESLIDAFKNSHSYVDATTKINFLEKFNRWNSDQLSRLSLANEENTQVNEAWGVPERISAILKKYNNPNTDISMDEIPF